MPKIHILPEQLANQIAAGEVVERPASVVKELIENSLDAGADRIEVEIDGGGTRLIRIIDNGDGMDADDLFLCLERHGTSKIRDASDLTTINTLGFRGEALPSIGSVSQMSLTSRTALADLGHHIELKYGALVKSHEVGCSVGTIIEIRNLFGNTPARRKFLRTVRTELNHIDEVIKNYSLIAPHITFILRVDGKETIHFNNSLTLEQRLGKIINHRDDFLSVDFAADTTHLVRGLLVPPEQVTLGPAKLRVFVNGRAVRDRMVIHATSEGLRGFLMKGKNPAGLIHVTLPPEEIDVNVHPAKHEIRFRHPREVHALVQHGVSKAMQHQQGHLQRALFGDKQTEHSPIPQTGSLSSLSPLEYAFFETTDPATANHDWHQKPFPPLASMPVAANNRSNNDVPSTYPTSSEGTHIQPQKTAEPQLYLSPKSTAISTFTDTNAPQPKDTQQELITQPPPSRLEILGQIDNLYIFCRTQKGLVVIDQHAAHERLLYEKLKYHFSKSSMIKQNLLFPETVELSTFQSQLLEKHLEDLEKMGFSLRDFGGNSYVISAIPALAGQIPPQKIFFDVLEQFGADHNNKRTAGDILDTILATMACRAAVKAGTSLSHQEMESLLKEMAAADLFSHCPHGRPVVKQFNTDEIKKWFYRT